MTKENLLFLVISVLLSAGRNIASKKNATSYNKKSEFFLSQTIIFGTATLILFTIVLGGYAKVSKTTLIYGVIYGVLLILSQWLFTIALKNGNTSVCSMVYSLGFIIPTISGSLFWNEEFTLRNGVGVILAIILIMFTANNKGSNIQSTKSYIPYIIISMLASGGLGIMQKVQATSKVTDEKSSFLLIAFSLAFVISIFSYLLSNQKGNFKLKTSISPFVIGGCFGGANFCNTILAGKMNSAVFFPLQNISTILITTLVALIWFKEKITFKISVILTLGFIIIILFSCS